MAGIVLGVAGAAVGGVLTGGSLTGIQMGWMAGSMLGNMVAGPQKQEGSILTDLKITGVAYGDTIPYVQAHPRVAGQIWWASDRRPVKNTTTTGGKGGGGVESTTYTYDVDLLIGLSDNPIIGVARVWNNGLMVYTGRAEATQASLDASAVVDLWDRMTVYTGAADQMPDPTYEAAVGTANACAYRGRGSVFIEGLHLGTSGSLPNLTFEIGTKGYGGPTAFNVNHSTSGITLTNSGRTISVDSGLGYTDFSVTQNKHLAAQNIYFEATCNGVSGNVLIGLINPMHGHWRERASLVALSGTDDYALWSSSGASLCKNGSGITLDSAGVSGFTGSDSLMFAANLTTGKVWLGKGGIWFNGGDPAAGTGAQFTGIGSTPLAIALVRDVGIGDSGSFDFNFGQTAFTYTKPTGFTGVNNPDFAATDSGRYWKFKSFGAPAGAGVTQISEVNVIAAGVAKGTQYFTSFRRESANGGGALLDGSFATYTEWDSSLIGNVGFFIRIDCGSGNGAEMDSFEIGSTSDHNANDYFPTGVSVYRSDDDINYSLVGAFGFSWPGNGSYRTVTLPASTAPALASPGIIFTVQDEALSTVVSRLCLRAGLTASQFDVTALSSITRKVHALSISQVAATRSTLELLMANYFFEMVVSDKIYFRPRGVASVATIPYLDLGAFNSSNPPDPLALQQANDLEMPAQIALTYIDVDNDYQDDTQYSDRLISAVAGTVSTMQMAIGMTPAEAKAVADTVLLDNKASSISSTIALLGDYCRLEPADPITVTGPNGELFRMRIIKKTDAYPLLSFDAVFDDVSVLASQGITSSDSGGSTVVTPAVGTVMTLLDIPILRDIDDDAGFYVAVKGDASPYPGSVVFSSIDNVDYAQKATILESGVSGTCTTTLGDWTGPRMFDQSHTVTVNVGTGTLESSTRETVLNDETVNAYAIGVDGRWELGQFVTATLVSAGIYTLSGLLRGSRGTEWAMTGHTASETFVLLREHGLRRITMQTADLAKLRYYKGVTVGRRLSTATAQSFTEYGIGLKPFSPVDLRIDRDVSNNVTFTWQRRSRLSVRTIGPLGISVPLGEQSEAYKIDVYSDGTYTTRVTTLSIAGDSLSHDSYGRVVAYYPASLQTSDGLTPGNTLYLRVYQVSAVVGLGYPLEAAA